MFDIYTKTVTIDGLSYELKPLSGKFLAKLYSLISVFKDAGEDLSSKMDEKTVSTMYEVCLETLKSSYPQENAEKLELFVSQNLIAIFPVVVEINLGGNVQPR